MKGKVFSAFSSASGSFRGAEGCRGAELTSGLAVMDVSIRDMKTRSVTDISIIEISHSRLPCYPACGVDRGRQPPLCCRGWLLGQKSQRGCGGRTSSLLFPVPHCGAILASLSLPFSPRHSLSLAFSQWLNLFPPWSLKYWVMRE